jgi:hypothetical protein
MEQEAGKEERRILEKYSNLLSKDEETLLRTPFEMSARSSDNFSIKKRDYTRQKISPSYYLSSQKSCVVWGVLMFVLYRHLANIRHPLPPTSLVENFATYGIFGAAVIVLLLRIKFYDEKEKSIFYTKILTLISALWLFFNMNLYFGYIAGLSLSGLLIVLCVCLYHSHKTDFALLCLAIISFFCLFAIIGKMWITVIPMGLFGVIRKIVKNFDPLKCRAADVNVYFLMSNVKGFHIIQFLGGICFLGVNLYASEWLKIPLGMQLTCWGVFLWHVMMTLIYFDAVMEYHKAIVFSEE